MRDYPKHVVGRSLPRVDIIEKVTGAARYSRDTLPNNAMALALVGSPHSHLNIRRIDVKEALQVPGVVRVITAHDLPGHNTLPWSPQPFLAGVQTHYIGEPVALVVARDNDAAQRAARRIHLDCEKLPAITSIAEALAPEAPPVSPQLTADNIWNRWSYETGSPTTMLAQSEVLLEQTYTSDGQTQDLLESPSVLTHIDPQDGLRIEGSTNHPYLIQEAVAHLLDLPYNRIQVVQHALRGSSQGHALRSALLASYTALAAWLTGHSVQLKPGHIEAFRWFGQRPRSEVWVKLGSSRSGELLACHLVVRLDVGAYPQDLEALLHRTMTHAIGPYRIPHVRVEVVGVATHTPPTTLLAGYGQFSTCFARESLLDELAQRLHLDPVSLRERNLLAPGDDTPWGPAPPDIQGLHEALRAATEAVQWPPPSFEEPPKAPLTSGDQPLPSSPSLAPVEPPSPASTSSPAAVPENEALASPPAPVSPPEEPARAVSATLEEEPPRRVRGWGVALEQAGLTSGQESLSPQAMVAVHIQRDGTVLLNVPQMDPSSDNQTRLTQIAAEVLGAPFEAIRFLELDTTRLPAPTPLSLPTAMLVTGSALLQAIQPLRQTLLQQVARRWSCDPSEVTIGVGQWMGPEQQEMPFAEAVALCWQHGLPLAHYGSHSFAGRTTTAPSGRPPPSQAFQYPAFAYAVTVAEVEVDVDSLEVELLSLTLACDTGKVLNPMLARHQLVRSAFHGLTYTFCEAHSADAIDPSEMVPRHPLHIMRQPPTIHPILIEHPHAQGPLGHKGLDGLPALGVAPAVVNAIAHALEQRIQHLPVKPESLTASLESRSFPVEKTAPSQGASS